jgi:hypothetical protein
MEMHTPITAFADVPHYPVNVDGVDVELLLARPRLGGFGYSVSH